MTLELSALIARVLARNASSVDLERDTARESNLACMHVVGMFMHADIYRSLLTF